MTPEAFLDEWHRVVREHDVPALDDAGRIRRLDVLMRPVNAVNALIAAIGPRMAEYFARAAANQKRGNA